MSKNKLKSLIQTSVNKALKSGEKEKTSTLRMSLSAIQKEEINKKSELTEEETILIIQKMIKQSKESSAQFEAAGRKELADKEKNEIKILSEFLPKQISEEEIIKIVEDAIEKEGAKSQQDIGKVMGTLKQILQGKAEMSLVSQIVRERLSN